jgi:hypothetical protein
VHYLEPDGDKERAREERLPGGISAGKPTLLDIERIVRAGTAPIANSRPSPKQQTCAPSRATSQPKHAATRPSSPGQRRYPPQDPVVTLRPASPP